jgi:hypothetical protein
VIVLTWSTGTNYANLTLDRFSVTLLSKSTGNATITIGARTVTAGRRALIDLNSVARPAGTASCTVGANGHTGAGITVGAQSPAGTSLVSIYSRGVSGGTITIRAARATSTTPAAGNTVNVTADGGTVTIGAGPTISITATYHTWTPKVLLEAIGSPSAAAIYLLESTVQVEVLATVGTASIAFAAVASTPTGAERILFNAPSTRGFITITTGGSMSVKSGTMIFTTSVTVKFRCPTIQIGTVPTNKVGFFGATPIVQPVVTGSRSSGAALTSLLDALALLGLIVNTTTT